MDEDEIRRFLDRYGQALSAGHLEEIVRCWDVPALVLSDQGALPVSSSGEIERFFAQAGEQYRSQGLVTTRLRLERAEALTEQLTSVDIQWAAFEAAGAERSSERSHYILQRGEDGHHRIRVALTRTTPP
jgi:hypothetical protein